MKISFIIPSRKKKEPPSWHLAHYLIYQDSQGRGFNEAVIISHTCQASCGWPRKFIHTTFTRLPPRLLSSRHRNPQIADLRVGDAAWDGLSLTCVLRQVFSRPGPQLLRPF